MSDETAKHFEVQQPGADGTASTQQARSFTLSITMQPDGSLELSGPLGNKVLAFGLLGAAHAQLTMLHLKSELLAAQKSRGGIEGLLKRMNGG